MEKMVPETEKEEDAVKALLKNREKREIRRQASEMLGEENVKNITACAYRLRDIKGQYTKTQRSMEQLEAEQEEIVSFYNSGERLQVQKGRSKSKNKLRKRVEIENIEMRMNELIVIIRIRRGVIERLRERHQSVKEEMIDLRRDEDCRRGIEVREKRELEEEEKRILVKCWTEDPSWGWEEIEKDVNNKLLSSILFLGGIRRSPSLRKYRKKQIRDYKENGVKLSEGGWLTDGSTVEFVEHLYKWLEDIVDTTYANLEIRVQILPASLKMGGRRYNIGRVENSVDLRGKEDLFVTINS